MIHSTKAHAEGRKKSKATEYLAGWKRERAEFDNYRKRMLAEKDIDKQRQRIDVLQPLLDIADNFNSIVRHIPPEIQENSWTQGVVHVARQFEKVLVEQGIEKIDETGVDFDPAQHEAVEKVPLKEGLDGQVIEVLQVGYKLGDMIVKPARVKVSEIN